MAGEGAAARYPDGTCSWSDLRAVRVPLLPNRGHVTVDLSINLQRDASAATVARAAAEEFVAGAVDRRGLSDLALVVSELVTNAVVHGRGAITLKLERDGEIVRGEVVDEGGGFERAIR